MKNPQMPADLDILGAYKGISSKKRITLEDAIELFINEAELRDLREVTIANYRQEMTVFSRFCESSDIFTNDIALINSDHVRAFQRYLKDERKVGNSTINHYCKSMKILIDSMIKKGYCKTNPFADVKLKVRQQEVGFTPSPEQMKRCINYQIERANNNYYQFRNLVILVMLSDTGMRVQELISLRRSNIHINEKGKEYVDLPHTKNGKSRKIGLSIRLVNLLKSYLPIIENMSSPYLFNSQRLNAISKREVQHIIKEIGKANDVPELSCHSTRRFFASMKIRENINPFSLMQLMGHSSIQVTQRYFFEFEESYLENKDLGIDN